MRTCHKCNNLEICSVGPTNKPVCLHHYQEYLKQARTAARRLFGLSPA